MKPVDDKMLTAAAGKLLSEMTDAELVAAVGNVDKYDDLGVADAEIDAMLDAYGGEPWPPEKVERVLQKVKAKLKEAADARGNGQA